MLYVLGFLFSKQGDKVWLINKNKPRWQAGKLNGIGGKIETGESAPDAMRREFKEEAGLDIEHWTCFGSITNQQHDYYVYCYYAFSDEEAKTMTDEKVQLCYTASLPKNVIPNINWLIPMALSFTEGETSLRFDIIHTDPDKNLTNK